MKPLIVFMNVGEEKIDKLLPVLKLLGIGEKTVDTSCLGDSAGYVAYPDEYTNCPEVGENDAKQDFSEEFMLLCGLGPKALDAVLNFMRKDGITVGLKAMLTETNEKWSLGKLISEITAERKAIAEQMRKRKGHKK